MLRKVNSGRLYNSITQHNYSLFDFVKGESERKEIYETTLPLYLVAQEWDLRVHAQR